ncbi:CBS domain-containing protein CBSX3, mitochondrial-like [Impatiens glandulifera]|uniref:CBS domain-containing protein CBSX3, mitochondrial-like n=1 Tax=Impatiens glandulifera TaxID=253017 RepID=UPI001FB19C34|nr:CBS domain-containing protein CBSX3, mitochondrial-like [Impatiens glandulifera]
MQAISQAIRSCKEMLRFGVVSHSISKDSTQPLKKVLSRWGCVTSDKTITENGRGLDNTTVKEVLMTKGDGKVSSWLWCRTNDSVYDAMKQMAHNDVGSLVVLKPGEEELLAGIVTERDYLKKIIEQDRQPKYTKVGEIMTDQNKLITVASDTKILQAMQIMTDNHIRHVPVVDGKIIGMISIVDVVRAVVEQQKGEVKQLKDFIKGEYY